MSPTIVDGRVSAARGDRDDVFSHGFICPKGASFPSWTTTRTGCRLRSYAATANWWEPAGTRALQAAVDGLRKWPPTAPPGSASTR